MGDNIYLGDRNGVRTPMQWSSDRNGGFSRADPARLYAPPIQDPVYGYQAINVEAQERYPFSLLNWMKRLIAMRRQHRVFGRGSLEFVGCSNRKVLAYLRRDDRETILVVANLSRAVQPAELDLQAFAGLMPVEMSGLTEFPRIGDAAVLPDARPVRVVLVHRCSAEPMQIDARALPTPAESERGDRRRAAVAAGRRRLAERARRRHAHRARAAGARSRSCSGSAGSRRSRARSGRPASPTGRCCERARPGVSHDRLARVRPTDGPKAISCRWRCCRRGAGAQRACRHARRGARAHHRRAQGRHRRRPCSTTTRAAAC